MSDDVQIDPAPTLEEFQIFARQKGLYRICDICTAINWSVQAKETGKVFDGTIPDTGLETYIPVFILSCGECGHIRLVNAATFHNWKRQHG